VTEPPKWAKPGNRGEAHHWRADHREAAGQRRLGRERRDPIGETQPAGDVPARGEREPVDPMGRGSALAHGEKP
jgi:hypothetical protein